MLVRKYPPITRARLLSRHIELKIEKVLLMESRRFMIWRVLQNFRLLEVSSFKVIPEIHRTKKLLLTIGRGSKSVCFTYFFCSRETFSS